MEHFTSWLVSQEDSAPDIYQSCQPMQGNSGFGFQLPMFVGAGRCSFLLVTEPAKLYSNAAPRQSAVSLQRDASLERRHCRKMRDERTKEKITHFETPKVSKIFFFSKKSWRESQDDSFFGYLYIGDYTTQFYGDYAIYKDPVMNQ